MTRHKEHFRLGEAAAIMGITYEALKGRCKRNSVAHIRIGKHRYISAVTLAELVPNNWNRYLAELMMADDIGA